MRWCQISKVYERGEMMGQHVYDDDVDVDSEH